MSLFGKRKMTFTEALRLGPSHQGNGFAAALKSGGRIAGMEKEVAVKEVTVKELHQEFKSAAEKALIEAKKIIAGADYFDEEHLNTLKRLGFIQAHPVKNMEKVQQLRDFAAAVEHYNQFYPTNKFITRDQITAICDKYGLIWSEPFRYVGDIPKKNIMEMSNFKLRDEDCMYVVSNAGVNNSTSGSMAVSFMISGSMGYNPNPLFYVGYEEAQRLKKDILNMVTRIGDKFFICAPPKLFNMERTKVVNHRLIQDDPIVMCEVNHGFLIVTAWGDEASDELVVNQKMN